MRKLFSSILDEVRWWARNRLPELNRAAEGGDASAVNSLITEGAKMAQAVLSQGITLSIEFVNYFTMIYSSVSRHRKVARITTAVTDPPPEFVSDPGFRPVVELIRIASSTLGIEPRFLAAPYLFENPYVDGRLAQFSPFEAETVFIEYNMLGTRAYERASHAVIEAWELGFRHPRFGTLMTAAKEALVYVRNTNTALAGRLNGDQFVIFRQYYAPVMMPGIDEPIEGVNAGDQPWPFVLDIVFGLALDQSRRGEARRKQKYLLPQDQALLDRVLEEERSEILPSILTVLGNPSDVGVVRGALKEMENAELVRANITALLEAIAAHAEASRAHWGLVQKFIIVPSGQGEEALGSTGLPVKLLKDLMELRRNSPNARLLTEALASS